MGTFCDFIEPILGSLTYGCGWAVSSMEVQSKNSVANYADRHPQCTVGDRHYVNDGAR